MRAAVADSEGFVERDGARLAFAIYGSDHRDTLLLTQTWQIIDSRHWKFMVPYLSRHYRVIIYDPVGNGRSDRIHDSQRYTDRATVHDALAVLDATDTPNAIAVGLSRGGGIATMLGALHPDRIDAVVAIAPTHPWTIHHPERAQIYARMFEPVDDPQGWDKYNVHHWRRNWADFVEFFFEQCCSDPYSTKLWDDTTEWAMEAEGELIALAAMSTGEIPIGELDSATRAMTMPVLIIHGTADRIINYESSLELKRRIPHAELMTLEGAGHLPTGRYPVRINHAIKDFADRVHGLHPSPRHAPPRAHRRRRALMMSSPIGLGHARRDVAIAEELRLLRPDLDIEWLAQDPVIRVLHEAGETIHPASAGMANETLHIESEAGEHDLAIFQTLRDMDEIQVANFMIADEVIASGDYDLVIGDESWEFDHHLHENPALKKAPFVWLTDFVGYLPMPDRGPREAFVAADYNREMIEHVETHRSLRDRAIFVGNPDDIVPDQFGPELPFIRQWTEDHYTFSGYITGFDPRALGDRQEMRTQLGYGTDEKICVVAVGGSGVGSHLVRHVAHSAPSIRRAIPGLRFVIVTGPRIDPAAMPRLDGVEYLTYVDRLYRHLAAADFAIVQGGLTTTMELAACKVPFIYVPLRHHFEQNFHVRARLDRYGAGRLVEFDDVAPDLVASIMSELMDRPPDVRDVEVNGASRAASLIAELL